MIQELLHRIDPLLTGWAACHNNATTALRDRWRLVYEVRKIVTKIGMVRVTNCGHSWNIPQGALA